MGRACGSNGKKRNSYRQLVGKPRKKEITMKKKT
jgi:hypothetical protein